jgi:hypothetical protein
MSSAPSIGFRNALRQLFFLGWSKIVDVNAGQQTFGIDGLQDLLLYVLGIDVRIAQQASQRRLVLDLPFRLLFLPLSLLLLSLCLLCHPPARLLLSITLLGSVRMGALLSPSLSISIHSLCAPSRGLRIHMGHTQVSDISQEPLILTVIVISMGEVHLWYDIVSRFIMLSHLLLITLRLALVRVRLQKALQQCRQPPVSLGASYGIAT